MSLMMIGELSIQSLSEEGIDKERVESIAKLALYRAKIEALGVGHPRDRAHVAAVFRITSYGENSAGAPKAFVWDIIEAFERKMPGLLDWVMITIHPSESCSQTVSWEREQGLSCTEFDDLQLRRQIHRAMAEAMTEGETIDDVAARIALPKSLRLSRDELDDERA